MSPYVYSEHRKTDTQGNDYILFTMKMAETIDHPSSVANVIRLRTVADILEWASETLPKRTWQYRIIYPVHPERMIGVSIAVHDLSVASVVKLRWAK